ncbi:MAG: DUF3365 domain-containing protein [Candidatus Binatia bacterium]
MSFWASLSIALSMVAAAFAAEAPSPQVEEARREAEAAADRLTSQLMAKLTAALAEGGPVQAVGVCSDVAQQLTTAASEKDRIAVRRTTLKYRNAVNAPDGFERAWLERAGRARALGEMPAPYAEVVVLPSGKRELRYLRPIIFPGGVCSQCHGMPDEIPRGVAAVLRTRYPADRATGFKPGDLRGAVSVRVALPAHE